MKITLVYPAIEAIGFDSFDKNWYSDCTFMPHGLALLAACCKQAGHAADAIDLRRLKGWDDFCGRIARDDAPVYGISTMSGAYHIACQCARLIRQTKPQAKILVGGVHPSIAPQEVAANPDFDHVVVGEGEIIVPQMLSDFEAGRDVPRVVEGPRPNLDDLPLPDRDLFGFEEGEMRFPWLPMFDPPFVTVMINRGCPFRCTFCQPAGRVVFGGKVRRRSTESVFNELHYLRDRYHFQSMMIHDDLFIMHNKSALEFARRYKADGFTAPFICQSRADIIAKNPQVVEALADAGLRMVLVGFESGSQRVLDFIKKGTTIAQNVEAVRVCRRAKVRIFANIMFGFPTETRDEVMRTVEFVRWMKPYSFSPTFFTPFPGSVLYDYCQEHGLSLIKDYAAYRRNPTGPKIKGVDYDFLNYALVKSREWQLDQELAQLAQAASSSPPAVQQHYAQLVSLKQQVLQADRQLGYVPQPPSRYTTLHTPPLRKGRPAKVAVATCASYDYPTLLRTVGDLIESLGGTRRFIFRGDRVLIKLNLTGPYTPQSQVVTHPLVAVAVAMHVAQAGGRPIFGDTPGGPPGEVPDFDRILEVAGYLGMQVQAPIEVVAIGAENACLLEQADGVVLKEVPVSSFLETVTSIINVPKLKTHSVTVLSAGVQNILGLVPTAAKGEFFRAAADPTTFSQALVDLAAAVCPELTILDAVTAMHGPGPLGGTPIQTGFLAAADNPFALDWYVAQKLGIALQSVLTLRNAGQRGLIGGEFVVVGPAHEVQRTIVGFRVPTLVSDANLALHA